MATIPEALAIALQHHQAGRLQAAEQIYRQILAVDPNQPEALHLLGVIASQVGKPELAVEHIERAIELNGTDGVSHFNLGNTLKAQGKLEEAVACYRRAIELKPNHAEAHNNLGNAFLAQGSLDDAVACYRRAIELKPDFANAHYNLGNTFQTQGKLEEAIACYREALELKLDLTEAHNNLGNIFLLQRKPEDAVACYRRAIELKPLYTEAHNNLGNAFLAQGKLDEALASVRKALEIKPDFAEAHNKLGNILECQGNPHAAAACYRRALELKPDFADARSNLDNIELDYTQRWLRSGGNLHRCDEIQDFDAYLKIEGWFDFQDIYDSAVAEARPGGVLVEVGCWKGRSTAYLGSRVALAQKQVSIYAIDPWLGWDEGRPVSYFGHFLQNMIVAGLVDLVTPLRMMSAQAAQLFADQSVDFCFIDGDHRYKAVSEDLRCWFPKIRPGGLIGGHDYVGPDSLGVKQAVDEFFQSPVLVSGKSWLTRKGP